MAKKIKLNTHLKRMVTKASIMCWSIKKVHLEIDKIIKEHLKVGGK